MSDITALVNTTRNLIENKQIEQVGRPYLGMSGIGKECSRAQWYAWRWVYTSFIEPRVQRIFDRGDIEEARVIKDLDNAGMYCYRLGKDGVHYPITGAIGEEQEEFVHFTGHSLGHSDGRIIGLPEAPMTPHLLEIKSCNDKYFKLLVKLGVEEQFPEYYAQMQIYMRYTGLERALFVATNKNDEARHYERVYFHKEKADMLHTRILDILSAETPPPRISKTPDFFKCKFCNAKKVCFEVEEHNRHCRTCTRAELHDNGIWKCGISKHIIPVEIQRIGCKHQYKSLL